MISKPAWPFLFALACGPALGQTALTPARFEIADVHVTSKELANAFMEANPPRNGRYEFHSASLIDLIRLAYEFEEDKILGGPSWLEMNRFEVIAQVPTGTSATTPPGSAQGTLPVAVREMLQSLLADRFKLTIRQENRPLPGYALTLSKLSIDKKPLMKEGDGTGDTGCKYTPPTDPADTTLRFSCRNMSMDAFAVFLPRLTGAPTGGLVNKTELKGVWNFELRLPRNASLQSPASDGGPAAAIEKQLGLKLEPHPIPTPVLVVGNANETPTANVAGVAEALPTVPQPTAFEVASMKPTDPAYPGATPLLSPKPGGLYGNRGVTLSSLLVRAFSPSYAQRNEDLVVGVPGWVAGTRYDITARTAPEAPANARVGPMLRSLLEDRLKLKWHTEERPVSVYVLVAAKPKLKKADPLSRTHCLFVAPPAGSPPNSTSLTCQNATIGQFADAIKNRIQGPGSPVLNSTGLEGGWDFTLTYTNQRVSAPNPAGQGDLAQAAPDPNQGLTIAEAIEKQLGLKLETQKRPMTVTVIDHLEQTPTDN